MDKAKAAIPKEKKLVKERTFDETTGKGKTRLHFEEKDKPPGFKEKHNPLSRPTQEAGILVHNKIHSVEKDNSGVEGAHKSEEAAERGLKYGARKIKQGYRNHKLKPYREAAKAEKAAFRANMDFQYHKTLHENPQLTSNPISRFWQKQKIKRQYAKEARNTAKGIKGAAERTRKAAAKAAEKTKQTAAFVARHPAGVAIAVGVLLLFIMVMSGLSSCGAMFSGTLNGVLGTSYTSEDSDLVEVENSYAGLENELQSRIDNIERDNPGYDEYRYDLANIGHNPHKEICVMIKDHLEKYNYQVFFTLTGANAIERIKELSPDLIILDLMLPFISGDELIRNIRKFSDVPVIVVSAKSLTFNKVELLRLGADDYLTKPFDLDELLARIERNLLRSQKDTPHLCLTFGELSINTSSKIVTVADEIIVLTAKEYQLVELLAKYPDKVFSKQNLYESIWQEPFARDNDVINTHISNLRKKLKGEGCRIKTIWGLGYRFAK